MLWETNYTENTVVRVSFRSIIEKWLTFCAPLWRNEFFGRLQTRGYAAHRDRGGLQRGANRRFVAACHVQCAKAQELVLSRLIVQIPAEQNLL